MWGFRRKQQVDDKETSPSEKRLEADKSPENNDDGVDEDLKAPLPKLSPSSKVEEEQVEEIGAIDEQLALEQSAEILRQVTQEIDLEDIDLGDEINRTEENGDVFTMEERAKKADKLIKDYCIKVAVATTTANSAVLLPGVGTMTGRKFFHLR